MTAGPRLQTFPCSKNGNQSTPFSNRGCSETSTIEKNPSPTSTVLTSTVSYEDHHNDDCDLSDDILRYISEVLMEEDMDDKACIFPSSLDLEAAEKSFYDALGEQYVPSPETKRTHTDQNDDTCDHDTPWVQNLTMYCTNSTYDGVGSCCGDQSICQFRKGVEEASKFLPSSGELTVASKGAGESSSLGLRGTKNRHGVDSDLKEERRSKIMAIYPEPTVRSKIFDEVLLCNKEKGILQAYREALKNGTSKKKDGNGKSEGEKGKRARGRRAEGKKEVVDLRSLLIHCAQAVAIDDHRNASELLKEIRKYSSPFGDGNQRLAYCFANGLESRLAGTGSQIYRAIVSRSWTASDYLKAYHLYLASCPFRKISNFASNRTILESSKSSMRLHIIDFGILYGFQWPTCIQRFSAREGGPPKIRITGIDFPQPGFRPSAGVEETGHRLADYAQSFNVPFDYNGVAKRWDTITLEDLKLEKDEFVVVNCLYRAKMLHDEIGLGSSRDKVINLMRRINPDIFIHGIINGAYNAPFFVTRFREALFHFSALFDMLEANVPREHHERMLIEREILGKEALNVIACEGWERVERPETYKQWHARTLRVGFGQIPFNREIVARAKDKVRSAYHRDFMIDEDNRWLLQGWKGRIVYALSCWKPI